MLENSLIFRAEVLRHAAASKHAVAVAAAGADAAQDKILVIFPVEDVPHGE